MENSGNYICIVETIINGTEEKYNQSVTIDIRNIGEYSHYEFTLHKKGHNALSTYKDKLIHLK